MKFYRGSECTVVPMSDSSFPIEDNPERVSEFVELYTRNYARLQYYLMALVPTLHDATDILQETSLVLWQKFDTFEPGTNFMAWACKIARFQALKQYKKNERAPRLFETEVLDLLAKDAEKAAARPDVHLEVLDQCIKRLSVKDQTLIKKRYEPNSSVKKLANDIGRNANSVSKSIGRIRRILLDCIKSGLPPEWLQPIH